MTSEKEKNDILKAIEKDKAYSFVNIAEIRWNRGKSNVYVFPKNNNKINDIEKKMLSLFDNATVYVIENSLLVKDELKCPNNSNYVDTTEEIKEIFVIKNGEIKTTKQICESCKYMVDKIVGSCKETKHEPEDGKNHKFTIKEELKEYKKIKPGYIRTEEFAKDVDFSINNVKNRIEYFDKKGKWRKELNSTRKNICSDCVKYKTHTCQKGFTGQRSPIRCHYKKEDLIERLKKECIEDFRSLGRAFWYFSQCGQCFEYKDPMTQRTSKRYISVPAEPQGYERAKGFFMSFARYPFEIGDYGFRHRRRYYSNNDKKQKKKHINYLSEYEYKKNHSDLVVKTRYKKEYEELLLTIYAIYKHIGSTPGQSYFMDSFSNYLVYMGIRYGKVEVGIGASKWKWEKTMKNLNDLFNVTVFNIEKL